MIDDYVTIDTNLLPEGAEIHHAMLDSSGEALLMAGSTLTPRFFVLLRRQVALQVLVHREDAERWGLIVPQRDKPTGQRHGDHQDELPPLRVIQPPIPLPFANANDYPAPRALLTSVRRHLQERHDDPPFQESRQYDRFPVGLVVSIVPLDADFRPAGDAFQAVLQELSQGGFSVVNSRALEIEYLGIEIKPLTGGASRMIARVMRCESFGRFYSVGCRLIGKIP
ncbi:hypothetical protein [Planctomycetes bacterium Pan216]